MILVDGATGFLGSHLTHKLTQEGRSVRCLVRKNARSEEVALLKKMGAQVVEGSLADPNAAEFFQGVEYAVHLIGSIAPKKGESFEDIHQALTRRFCELAKSAGVKKIVLITALGTASDAPSQYHRTKWLAEEEVRKSGLSFTILRPSLLIGRVIGSRNSKLVARLLGFIQNKQFVPLVNGGANKIQPIFISDCVEAISNCISDRHDGEIIELGGSTVLSMKRFVEELGAIVGKRKPIINLPPQAGKLLAAVMEMVQDVPTLSSDQVVLSLNDNICQSNGLATVIGRDGAALDVALETYRKNPVGTFIPI
ncbi:NAD(P)H-binding protein [Candidatus Obscuribacterales bacterium]|nr:NAD(P)H-binding protein [Candidatus Obscuribacterales bacterium]MBX3153946.1 NAD(P)H-binding protein [Candidatus Obscuribacterales bacterium]